MTENRLPEAPHVLVVSDRPLKLLIENADWKGDAYFVGVSAMRQEDEHYLHHVYVLCATSGWRTLSPEKKRLEENPVDSEAWNWGGAFQSVLLAGMHEGVSTVTDEKSLGVFPEKEWPRKTFKAIFLYRVSVEEVDGKEFDVRVLWLPTEGDSCRTHIVRITEAEGGRALLADADRDLWERIWTPYYEREIRPFEELVPWDPFETVERFPLSALDEAAYQRMLQEE